MKPLVTSFLLLVLSAIHARPGWENKVIGNIRIEVPIDCKADVQHRPGAGSAVQKMKKYSFRNRMLDLELAFLSFPPGIIGNLNGAAANMNSQLKTALGEESLTPWKATTVSDARLDTSLRNRAVRVKQGKQPSSMIPKLRTNSS